VPEAPCAGIHSTTTGAVELSATRPTCASRGPRLGFPAPVFFERGAA